MKISRSNSKYFCSFYLTWSDADLALLSYTTFRFDLYLGIFKENFLLSQLSILRMVNKHSVERRSIEQVSNWFES